MGVNHLGHMHLASLLLPLLRERQGGGRGRVVVVSSSAAGFGRIRLDLSDVGGERARSYSPWGAYGASKLANQLYARELARRLGEEGAPIDVLTLHPGAALGPSGCRAGRAGQGGQGGQQAP